MRLSSHRCCNLIPIHRCHRRIQCSAALLPSTRAGTGAVAVPRGTQTLGGSGSSAPTVLALQFRALRSERRRHLVPVRTGSRSRRGPDTRI